MKKNLLLRLCLILSISLTLSSCRTDHLNENEITYNNSSKFQLTSKRISLDESKHKEKLVSELQKVETKFKNFSKTNAQGKTVNYGNGISIDTDDVIFIENGPDYHTYTFHLKKENDLPSDPVENLVLSPMVDGSYKELLVSYQLTPSEKATLSNGGYVDTTGKTTVTELAAGTYTPLSKGLTSCGWVESYTFMGCSDVHNGVSTHNENNMSDWKDCKADRKPGLYMTMTYRCDFSGMTDDMGNPSNPSGSSGSSGGGSSGTGDPNYDDSGNNTSPCANGGVLDEPQDLTTDPGDGNCSGIPTQPNLPILDDPCRKTKASVTAANLLKNPDVQTQMDAVLKGKISAPNEWGVAVGQTSGVYEVTAPLEGGDYQSTSPVSQLNSPLVANGHSHAGRPGDPSGGDLYAFLDKLKNYDTYQHSFMYGINNGTNEVYALVINDRAAALQFLTEFPMSENYDPVTRSIKTKSELGEEFHKMITIYNLDPSGDLSGENLESYGIAMAYILDKFNAGISVAKVDANGNLKKINATLTKGGILGEKAKISKCP